MNIGKFQFQWNCFKIKGSVRETSERQDGAHNYELFQAHRHHRTERNGTVVVLVGAGHWSQERAFTVLEFSV